MSQSSRANLIERQGRKAMGLTQFPPGFAMIARLLIGPDVLLNPTKGFLIDPFGIPLPPTNQEAPLPRGAFWYLISYLAPQRPNFEEVRRMRDPLRLSSHATEMYSAFLRWFFFIVLVFFAYFPQFNVVLIQDLQQFKYLMVFGFLYMGVTQVVLHLWDEDTTAYKFLTKAGVIFDGIALFWLLYMSGGAHSPLFPISYLITIHAAIYWNFIGAVTASVIVFVFYSLMIWGHGGMSLQDEGFFHYILNVTFLFLLGMYGGVLASRERHHLKQKNLYQTQAIEDYLTGVYNHRHFQENLRTLVQSKANFYLVMTDIDHFKKINDAFGHVTGDTVLRGIAGVLEDTLPEHKGQVFRYGGEEFAILLPGHPPELVDRYINSVMKKLEDTVFEVEGQRFTVTLSFGVAKYVVGQNPNDIVKKADRRLYIAKQSGRNQAISAGD